MALKRFAGFTERTSLFLNFYTINGTGILFFLQTIRRRYQKTFNLKFYTLGDKLN